MKLKTGALAAFSLAVLAGCSSSAPKCSDTETIDLVKEIVLEALTEEVGQFVAAQFKMELHGIRATDVNEKTGAQECAEQIELSGPNGTVKGDNT